MRLADFIEQNVCLIADGAQAFAATQTPQGVHLDETALRDHIPEILLAVVADLRTKQSVTRRIRSGAHPPGMPVRGKTFVLLAEPDVRFLPREED